MRILSLRPKTRPAERRRGAAAVEFAVMSPLFVMLILGLLEGGRGFEVANTIEMAIREGGRLASMEWDGIVPRESNPNQKVIDDIRAFLKASKIDADKAEISITSAEGDDEGEEFILHQKANVGRYFKIRVAMHYEDLARYPIRILAGRQVVGEVVFRAADVQTW